MSFIVQFIRLGSSPPLTQQMHSFHKYHWGGIKQQKEKREHNFSPPLHPIVSNSSSSACARGWPFTQYNCLLSRFSDRRESRKKLRSILSVFNALGHLLKRLLVITTEIGGNCWFIDGMFSSCCRFNLKNIIVPKISSFFWPVWLFECLIDHFYLHTLPCQPNIDLTSFISNSFKKGVSINKMIRNHIK